MPYLYLLDSLIVLLLYSQELSSWILGERSSIEARRQYFPFTCFTAFIIYFDIYSIYINKLTYRTSCLLNSRCEFSQVDRATTVSISLDPSLIIIISLRDSFLKDTLPLRFLNPPNHLCIYGFVMWVFVEKVRHILYYVDILSRVADPDSDPVRSGMFFSDPTNF